MERKRFLKTSTFLLGGFWALQTTAFTIKRKHQLPILLQNKHIRHGYYNNSSALNNIKGAVLHSVKIDHFLNPEGNMLLIDCKTLYGDLRLSIYPQELIYEFDNKITELAFLEKDAQHKIISNNIVLIANATAREVRKHKFKNGLLLSDNGTDCFLINSLKPSENLQRNRLVCLFT